MGRGLLVHLESTLSKGIFPQQSARCLKRKMQGPLSFPGIIGKTFLETFLLVLYVK
jgi:hypothetical protein